jgi:DUF4097 and DUF4098 domain-containing protein YvlB
VTASHDAEDVEVHLAAGGRHLVVVPPGRHRRQRVDVVIDLPVGSEVRIGCASADVTVDGRVSKAEITTASGAIRVDEVDGRTKLRTASGSVRAESVGGDLDVRTASGSIDLGHVGGHSLVRTASGSITMGQTDGSVSATTASGSVAVGEAHTGAVDLRSTSGRVEVGVRRGTLVWLDVTSVSGAVRSDLAADGTHAVAGNTPDLTVRARSVSGSVTVSSVGSAPIAL